MTAHDPQPVLRMQDVGIYYGKGGLLRNRNGRWVLRGISFDLYHGESLGVIGRNGIGKSTLLRTMAGIIAPDEGRVAIQPGKRAALLSLRTGFSPQLSGRENIYLSAMMQGMGYEEVRAKVEDIIAFTGIGNEIDDALETYSDGMKARLGFAISIQIQPDILLLDEVLGVGDAVFRKKSAEAMRARIRSDQTVVLVSHNAETIRDLCTRAVWIDGGTIRAAGDVDAVLAEYGAAAKA